MHACSLGLFCAVVALLIGEHTTLNIEQVAILYKRNNDNAAQHQKSLSIAHIALQKSVVAVNFNSDA